MHFFHFANYCLCGTTLIERESSRRTAAFALEKAICCKCDTFDVIEFMINAAGCVYMVGYEVTT